VHPVLIDFDLPLFLGTFHWLEGLITVLALVGLWTWLRRSPGFSWPSFAFWVAVYAAVRALVWYAGPGYHFKLHTYGVMIAIGFVVAIALAARQARREGIPSDVVLDLAFWILIASMVGSRVLFIIVNMDQYIAQPINLIKVWQGGLVFYGGLLGAVAAAVWYCTRKGISFLRIADVMIPSVAIGHAFGRLGCFSAGCCHGLPTGTDAFGLIYTASGTVVARNDLLGVPLHPTQLYESAGELIIFTILVLMRRRKRFHGQLLIAYLFMYAILRSVGEMFRGDYDRGMLTRWDLFGDAKPELLSTSQLISLILAAVAIGLLVSLLRKRKQAASPPDTEPAPADPPDAEE